MRIFTRNDLLVSFSDLLVSFSGLEKSYFNIFYNYFPLNQALNRLIKSPETSLIIKVNCYCDLIFAVTIIMMKVNRLYGTIAIIVSDSSFFSITFTVSH